MLNFLFRISSRHPLARELALVLAIKMVLLTLASVFLFGADQRVPVDAGVITHQIFDRNLSQGM
jgi:hypothetical protein